MNEDYKNGERDTRITSIENCMKEIKDKQKSDAIWLRATMVAIIVLLAERTFFQ